LNNQLVRLVLPQHSRSAPFPRGSTRVKPKLLVLVAALALATGSLVAAPGTVRAVTYGDCDIYAMYGQDFNIGRYTRDSNWYPGYDAIKADILIKELAACTNPDTGYPRGFTGALVNMDQTNAYVQLGYGKADCPTGQSCALPDNQRVWVYTPADNTGGVLDDWSGIPAPILGRTYGFAISLIAGPKWRLYITDRYINVTYTRDITATVTSMRAAFWMFEVHSYGDRLGSTFADGWLRLANLYYSPINNSNWILAQDASGACDEAPQAFAWYHDCRTGAIIGTNAAYIEAQTADH
jgi:hypothetical protein